MATFGLVFPGQGSQYPGMGRDIYRNDQRVRTLFADTGAALGRDMASLCFAGTPEPLDLTVNTQISALTADLAAGRAFSGRVTAAPLVMAGHSLIPVIPNCAPDLLHARECTKELLNAADGQSLETLAAA